MPRIVGESHNGSSQHAVMRAAIWPYLLCGSLASCSSSSGSLHRLKPKDPIKPPFVAQSSDLVNADAALRSFVYFSQLLYISFHRALEQPRASVFTRMCVCFLVPEIESVDRVIGSAFSLFDLSGN